MQERGFLVAGGSLRFKNYNINNKENRNMIHSLRSQEMCSLKTHSESDYVR